MLWSWTVQYTNIFDTDNNVTCPPDRGPFDDSLIVSKDGMIVGKLGNIDTRSHLRQGVGMTRVIGFPDLSSAHSYSIILTYQYFQFGRYKYR